MRSGALRPVTARAAARQGKMRTRLTAGEKPNRKRMATLACVYDAEPARRRPHDVIAPPGGRHGYRTPRPRPRARAKWLTGSVEHDPAEVIAAAAFNQAEARDPGRRRTWVVLVDGAGHQLDLIRAEAARRGVTVHIVLTLRGDQQRRLRGILALPPCLRAPPALPRHGAGQVRAPGLTRLPREVSRDAAPR